MIKVLHFVSTPSIGSGVMSVIMNYYRHMDRSRIQFDFLCFLPCEESYEAEIQALGGRIFFIPKPGSSLRSLLEMRRFFRDNAKAYQWLHNHEVYLSFLLEPMARRYGIRHLIIHSHATKYSDRKPAAIRNGILCFPIRFTKAGKFACSEDAGEFLFGKGTVASGECYILHNAIDVKKYVFDREARFRLRKKYGLENCFVIGHVGRFMPQKNHKFLITVVSEAVRRNPDIRLLLIGDGPLKAEIMEECRAKGLDDFILFLGRRDDVESLLNIADLFVLPSLFEGIGIALLEAQANGLPGIASVYVPEEVNVTGDVCFLPLEDKLWADAIIMYASQLSQRKTEGIETAFQKNHYEIQMEAEKLQKYYENTDTHVRV